MCINMEDTDVSSKVHYMPGKTPLVGWIKGYMVPELLGIEVDSNCLAANSTCFQVCQELQEQQPAEYGGMKTYLKKTYDRWIRVLYFCHCG